MSKEADMLDLLEKAFLAGLGAISLSLKKTEELLAELKNSYKMSEEEGRAFLEKLQKLTREGKDRVAEMVESEVKSVVERLGVVPRSEFDQLRKRVEELEKKNSNP
jgi:polyhydroxyalkanoate synthesis regulator phasin